MEVWRLGVDLMGVDLVGDLEGDLMGVLMGEERGRGEGRERGTWPGIEMIGLVGDLGGDWEGGVVEGLEDCICRFRMPKQAAQI